jgi:hypothetical protein
MERHNRSLKLFSEILLQSGIGCAPRSEPAASAAQRRVGTDAHPTVYGAAGNCIMSWTFA